MLILNDYTFSSLLQTYCHEYQVSRSHVPINRNSTCSSLAHLSRTNQWKFVHVESIVNRARSYNTQAQHEKLNARRRRQEILFDILGSKYT